jgi:hypothetical protein
VTKTTPISPPTVTNSEEFAVLSTGGLGRMIVGWEYTRRTRNRGRVLCVHGIGAGRTMDGEAGVGGRKGIQRGGVETRGEGRVRRVEEEAVLLP